MLQDHNRRIPFFEFILRGFLSSLGFFTRIPLPSYAHLPLMKSAWSFTITGAIPSLFVAGIGFFMLQYLPNVPAFAVASIMIVFDIILRGPLHEDGIADTFDALGAARKKKEITSSSIGAFGTSALIIVFISRLSIYYFALIEPKSGLLIIFITASVARIMAPVLVYSLKVAKSSVLAHGSGKPSMVQIIFSIIPPFLIIFGFFDLKTAILFAITLDVCSFIVFLWVRRTFKAINGDIIGASIIITELFTAMMLLILNQTITIYF